MSTSNNDKEAEKGGSRKEGRSKEKRGDRRNSRKE